MSDVNLASPQSLCCRKRWSIVAEIPKNTEKVLFESLSVNVDMPVY